MTLEFPAHLFKIESVDSFKLVNASFVSRDPLSQTSRVYGPNAVFWKADLEFVNMKNRAVLSELDAFFARLDGQNTPFLMYPPHRCVSRGAAAGYTGTGSVYWDSSVTWDGGVLWAAGSKRCKLRDAASAGASRVILQGLVASQSESLKAGDMIGIGGNLYMVINDARSDANGYSAVNIRPRLRKGEAADTRVDLHKPKGRFQLAGQDADQIRYGIVTGQASLSVIEVPITS